MSTHNRSLKILHVIANLDEALGGPVKACREQAEALVKRGHKVEIYTTDWQRGGTRRQHGSQTQLESAVPVYRFPTSFKYRWPVSWKLWRGLRTITPQCDVVHIHSLYHFHCWVAGDISRRHGVPYLVSPHGSLDPYIRKRGTVQKAVADSLFQARILS